MRRVGVILAVAASLLGAAPSADASLRPRPTDAPIGGQVAADQAPNALQVFDDYTTPVRTFSSARAVVHYVLLGADAPPLNDDDADGVPDYVERVGAAADRAVTYFERRRFARIAPDTGGPDARPDLYVSRFAPGYLGAALPAARARGGAFVAISNRLDPSPGPSFCSLDGTVAHELFHLVQFSYFRATEDPPLPGWVLEGAAAALERRVNPELDDAVTGLQLRRWFDDSGRSLAEQTYGAQLLWRSLDERVPGLLPAYLARLAGPRPPRSAVAALETTYLRVTSAPFARAFGDFAASVAVDEGDRIRPHAIAAAATSTASGIAPLAIHFVRVDRSVRSIAVQVTRGRADVRFAYRLESEIAGEAPAARRLRPRVVGGRLVFEIPPALRRSPRFGSATLVVANGHAEPARYTLRAG
jgi:hypothetical protein